MLVALVCRGERHGELLLQAELARQVNGHQHNKNADQHRTAGNGPGGLAPGGEALEFVVRHTHQNGVASQAAHGQ